MDAATRERIDPQLAFRLVSVESSFRSYAVSPVGAVGLTQVMPETANWLFPGTRKEDLLVDKNDLQKTFVLRRILNPMGTTDAIEFLLSKLKQTKSNSEFFDSMNT